MNLSLKLDDHHHQQPKRTPIHFTAKIPISIFTLPLLSAVSATHHHPSDTLSLSLRTLFPSGPSLKLSYTTPTPAPLTVTLKSGVSLYGSPNNSPFTISANFSFSPQNPNPSFTIQLKPKLGSFSLSKSVSSVIINNRSKKVNESGGCSDSNISNSKSNSYGYVSLDQGRIWKDLTVETGPILSGVLVMAETELPVTKRVKVNLRWGVSLPSSYEKQMPYLRVNKIKILRVDEVKEENHIVDEKEGIEFEMWKGMYGWMKGELSNLRKKNGEMRRVLEEIRAWEGLRSDRGYNVGGGKRGVGRVVENSDGFEQWRMKKNGGLMDVESELEKAIKDAS